MLRDVDAVAVAVPPDVQARRDPDGAVTALGTAARARGAAGARARLPARARSRRCRCRAARRPTWPGCPVALRGAVARPRAVVDRVRRRRRRRLRRLRLDAGLPRRPAPARPDRRARAATPGPGWPTGSAPGSRRTSRSTLPGHAAAARRAYVGLPLRRVIATLDRAALRDEAPARASGSTPTGRRCWSPAGRRARGGSTRPSPARPSAPAPPPASRCCTSSAAKGEALEPGAPATPPYVVRAVRRPDGPRLRRRRPRGLPGRRQHRRRADRGRPAGGLRAAADRQRRAARSTPGRSSTPAAALLVDDAELHPGVGRARRCPPLLADADAAGRDGARPRPRLVARDADERLAEMVLRRRAGRRARDERSRSPTSSLPADRLGRVHFVGIGGAGMSGIARIMLARGIAGQRQRRQGLARRCDGAARRSAPRVHVGHDAAHVARRRHRRRLHRRSARTTPSSSRPGGAACGCCPRSAALAVGDGRAARVVAVAGTHGKTTTTSMLTVGPAALRRRPVVRDRRRARRDRRPTPTTAAATLFVAEADESDGSFLVYSPVRRGRHQRRGRPPRPLRHRGGLPRGLRRPSSTASTPTGFLVACVDDAGAADLAERPATGGCTSSASASRRPRRPPGRGACASRARPRRSPWSTVVDGSGRVALQIPGRHYVLDALAALAEEAFVGCDAQERASPRAQPGVAVVEIGAAPHAAPPIPPRPLTAGPPIPPR